MADGAALRRLGPRPLALYLRLAAAGPPEQADRFLRGVRAYWAHPFRRVSPSRPAIWSEGAARLIDFGGRGRPILFVPSLINRAEVLDLLPGRSLLAHLAT